MIFLKRETNAKHAFHFPKKHHFDSWDNLFSWTIHIRALFDLTESGRRSFPAWSLTADFDLRKCQECTARQTIPSGVTDASLALENLEQFSMSQKKIVALVVIAVTFIVFYTQVTLFVIPPIGALPEGRTVVITRLNKTKFIDSPDAMCERIQGGVSLLCRGMVLGAVLDEATILIRLPYSSWLYRVSTGGKIYDR